MLEVSPHTRGWTRIPIAETDEYNGFPAHAGMDPRGQSRLPLPPRFPRTRGDGPLTDAAPSRGQLVSPHTRGWTLRVGGGGGLQGGFPAHAGMDPHCAAVRDSASRFPRTRGDGPFSLADPGGVFVVSPHTRGWTLRAGTEESRDKGFPAHAGMDPGEDPGHGDLPRFPRTRGDGPSHATSTFTRTAVSPHTRGWTRRHAAGERHADGFPAHAGMDPRERQAVRRAGGFPRTRGDGPGG